MKSRTLLGGTRAFVMAPALLLSLPGLAAAQARVVVPRATGPIALDGRVGEPAWEAVAPLPAVQQTPTFGAQPSEPTEFRLAYDDRYLYFSCRNYDADPEGIRATSLTRDDGSFTNDWCVINLDTFNDKETALVFGVSPAGVRTDAVFDNDGESAPNFSWSTFWDASVHRDEHGWYAEIRIPWSSLRFQQDAEGHVVMGLTTWRRIARKNEMITFPAVSPQWGFSSVFKASQSQEIAFQQAYSRKPLYLTPYALGGLGRTNDLNEAETEYVTDDQRVGEAGLDVKTGITENLTLDLTANTDFAQVEADDQQVNLTRFSLFFPEKRLFFQERASIFEYSLGGFDRLFYSRAIGLDEDRRQLRIYGGARVVGRVGSWDLGFLDLHTDAPAALRSENFGVLRLRRRVFNVNSTLGGILTSRIAADGSYNVAYGVDGIIRVFGQDYVTLNWSQTFDDDEPEAGELLDRGFVRVMWERRGIDGLTYSASASRAGAAFNPEMGFLRRSDFLHSSNRIAYGWRPGPESVLLRHNLGVAASLIRRNDLDLIETVEIQPAWEFETKAGHTLWFEGAVIYENLDEEFSISDSAGVPAGTYTFMSGAVGYGPPTANLLRTSLSISAGQFYDGWRVSGGISPTWNASRHLQISGSWGLDIVRFPDRSERFTAQIVRFRTRLMLTSALTATAFAQYNSAADVVIGNFRVRYNPREGVDLYLVYNEGRNTDRFRDVPTLPAVDERTLVVKYSHTLNLEF
ncbi:MAG: hypothetical protein GTN78_04110 [Gemmatimonadales bacterium]|nr:hypothetical protein [Gemmatimonadales bacterium]NIN12248.1 hypothetical protein [Gemmatimonadales bacterium]NIQ99371.1 hypothetical protein [Gemmatimonadales bacterium]NIS64052.1 hypothetical protein [Gemmatimonadales bacterium]